MAKQPGAKFYVDAVRRMREEISPQRAKNRFEKENCHKAYDQHIERAEASMHKHLVDHDLEEERRNKRKELEEKEAKSTSPSKRRYL